MFEWGFDVIGGFGIDCMVGYGGWVGYWFVGICCDYFSCGYCVVFVEYVFVFELG